MPWRRIGRGSYSSTYSLTSALVGGKSRVSSVGIALSYGLDYRGSRVRLPAGAGNSSLHHRVQNGSGVHLASYSTSTRGSFPSGKAAGAWGWPLHLVPRSRMRGAIPPLPQYIFMAWCLVKHRDNFTFTLLDGGKGSASRLIRFTLKERPPWYPLNRRQVRPQSRSGFEPPIIQPVAQRYTTELSRLHFSIKIY
jgi:hypothetical protein